VAFAITCFVHDFQMSIVTHIDIEQFILLMLQPAAIAIEGLTQEIFNKVRPQGAGLDNTGPALASYAGYIWVVLWFSISLPAYVKGCRDAGIVHDTIFGS
jgi:hypothetical protein